MAYKCIHCSSVYVDDAPEVISGCAKCKSKFFFYIKDEKLKELIKNNEIELDSDEKKKIEKDVRDIVGIKDEEVPVFLDFESVRVLKPGKYLIDVQKMFNVNKPRVYKLEDGKYIVDLGSASSGIKQKR